MSTRKENKFSVDGPTGGYTRPEYSSKQTQVLVMHWFSQFKALYDVYLFKDHYLVEYYDLRKKNVHHTWLSSWKPPPHVTQATTKEPIVKKVQKVSETVQTTSSTISSEESPVNDQLATDKDKTEIKTADNEEIPASDDTEVGTL